MSPALLSWSTKDSHNEIADAVNSTTIKASDDSPGSVRQRDGESQIERQSERKIAKTKGINKGDKYRRDYQHRAGDRRATELPDLSAFLF